jgi:hypothetical protein
MTLTKDPNVKMISVPHDNVRSLKKKKKLAYAPNLGPSRKDDQYCAASYLVAEMWLRPKQE